MSSLGGSYVENHYTMRKQFCTCHDSWAVVTLIGSLESKLEQTEFQHISIISSSLRWRHNGAIASQITSPTIVYSTVNSDANQRKHQSSASLAFVRGIHRWPVNSPHKWPVTRKMFPLDDVIMINPLWNDLVATNVRVLTWQCRIILNNFICSDTDVPRYIPYRFWIPAISLLTGRGCVPQKWYGNWVWMLHVDIWLDAISVTSHYLNQYSFVVVWTIDNKFQRNFNQNTTFFIQENEFESAVCKTAAVFPRFQCLDAKLMC